MTNLVKTLMGDDRLGSMKIFAGDVVSRKKPHPDIYNLAKASELKAYLVIEYLSTTRDMSRLTNTPASSARRYLHIVSEMLPFPKYEGYRWHCELVWCLMRVGFPMWR